MKILVTGGCGFIGSNFVRFLLKNTEHDVFNLDALTYAGNIENLRDIEGNPRYTFVHGRIENGELVNRLVNKADYIVHFAAESHVDRSILEPGPFITTNIFGVQVLLDASKEHIKKFIHISTDEVYGSLETDQEKKFTEESPFMPNSPYSASKASGDLLARAYYVTYGLPIVIVRPSNNYGYYQFPEKFIPLIITNLKEKKSIPVYGDGRNIRDWLFVEDTCRGIYDLLMNGRLGEVYNLGGETELKNIDIVKIILKEMGENEDCIEYVKDRPGHDYRYALDNHKIRTDIGWQPMIKFEEGIRRTIEWYLSNDKWWKPLKERLKKESKGFWS